MKHILITAGGTGGHVFPALAVAQVLRSAGWRVSWLGTDEKLEAQVVPKAGFEFHGMPQMGLRGRGILGWLMAPFRLLQVTYRMRRFLAKTEPDLVLGFGGYTAGPAGVAAWSKGIPLVIHEQNAAAGLTNKLLAKFAQRVLLGFAAAQQQLAHGEWVGNPVRAEIATLAKEEVNKPDGTIRILIVGGSLGAQHLNQVMPSVFAAWNGDSITVEHQTGRGKQEFVAEAYTQASNPQVQVTVSEFIEDMASAYQRADLVICRAGALTCSELACVGRASLLVPYPHAVDNHQLLNAQALAAAGGAIVIEQKNFTQAKVTQTLAGLFANTEIIYDMSVAARKEALPNAAERVAQVCAEVLKTNLAVEQA